MLSVGDHQDSVGGVVGTDNCLIDADLWALIVAKRGFATGPELRLVLTVRDGREVGSDARVENIRDCRGGQGQPKRQPEIERDCRVGWHVADPHLNVVDTLGTPRSGITKSEQRAHRVE